MDRKRKIDLSVPVSQYSSNPILQKKSKEFDQNSLINPWTQVPYSSKYYEILQKRQQLPVYEFRDDLLEKVRTHQVLVVEGETGSGKKNSYSTIFIKVSLNYNFTRENNTNSTVFAPHARSTRPESSCMHST